MKTTRKTLKSLFTKRRRRILNEQLEELNESLAYLSNLYDRNLTLRSLIEDEDLRNKAIEMEKMIFGQKKVISCKMKIIDKELEKLV